MRKKTLFIGWGNVVRYYYWRFLSKYFYRGTLNPVIAETSDKARHAPGFFLEWGSPCLDEMISKGVFDKIFILTPPHLHMEQLRYCMELLDQSCSKGHIFVEKPIDSDVRKARNTIRWLNSLDGPRPWDVHQIDHYTQKWTSRWLRSHHEEIVKKIAPIQEIIFVSFETEPIEESMSFEQGYALEHGTHAWAMIDYCFPDLSEIEVWVDPTTPPLTWRYKDCPAICPCESAFLIAYQARVKKLSRNYADNQVLVTIAAGKALEQDYKKMMIVGYKGVVVADFNSDKLHWLSSSFSKEIGTSNRLFPKQPAYKTIIDGIFMRDRDPKDVTIRLEEGLIALQRIEIAAREFPRMRSHKMGATPRELNQLLSQFPGMEHR